MERTAALVKIPRSDHEIAKQRGQIRQALRDQVQHITLALHLAAYLEQARVEKRRRLRRGYALPDDQVRIAGLILDRDEDDAAGAARALAGDDDSCGADDPAVRLIPQRLV